MEYKEVKKKFEEVYKSKIQPNILKLDIYRHKQKKKKMIYLLSLVIVFIYNVFIFIFKPEMVISNYSIDFLFLIYTIYTFTIDIKKIEKQYRKTVKDTFLQPILSIFGNFKITKNENISLKEIQETGLYHISKIKKDDDIITGIYNNTKIKIVETKLSHRTSSINGKERSSITDFSGLIIKFKNNKPFNGVTVVTQGFDTDLYIERFKHLSEKYPEIYQPDQIRALDSFPTNMLLNVFQSLDSQKLKIRNGKLCVSTTDKQSQKKINKQLEKIVLEDAQEAKKFKIYSDNPNEAKKLFDILMKNIKKIEELFVYTSIDFVFKENFVYVFLGHVLLASDNQSGQNNKISFEEDKGLFEISMEKSLAKKKTYFNLLMEFYSIISIVDFFQKDENIR